VIENVNKMTI